MAEFLAPSGPDVLIPVPAEPATDVSAAILAASTAMGPPLSGRRTYARAAVDHGLPGRRPRRLPHHHHQQQRRRRQHHNRHSGGRPALTITGTGEGLRTAARALIDTISALADGATVTGMTATVPAAAGPEQAFTDLGAQAIRLAGYGTKETYLGVNQSQLGGPVSAISLQLRGTHIAIPTGGLAALSVYWNDYLLSSQPLDGDTLASPPTSPPATSSPETASACASRPSPLAATAPAPAWGRCLLRKP